MKSRRNRVKSVQMKDLLDQPLTTQVFKRCLSVCLSLCPEAHSRAWPGNPVGPSGRRGPSGPMGVRALEMCNGGRAGFAAGACFAAFSAFCAVLGGFCCIFAFSRFFSLFLFLEITRCSAFTLCCGASGDNTGINTFPAIKKVCRIAIHSIPTLFTPLWRNLYPF